MKALTMKRKPRNAPPEIRSATPEPEPEPEVEAEPEPNLEPNPAAPKVIDVFDEGVVSTILSWRFYPELFAKEAMGWDGVNGPELTDQQIDLLRTVGKMARAKFRYRMAHDGLISESALTKEDWFYIKKLGISVMAGKGCGKGATLVLLMTWFLYSFEDCKSPITGPSYDQVRKGLIAETHKWLRFRSRTTGQLVSKVADEFEVQRDMIFLKKDGNQKRFFSVRTAPPDANESQQKGVLDGWHEDAMMIVVDEAASVPDGVFLSFVTTLSSPFNFAVMMFNPTRANGYAYDTHFGPRAESWVQKHWDSRESPLVTKAQLEIMERDYGTEGPEYRINVLGLPPVDDPSSLISRSWIQAAVDRHNNSDPKVWEHYPRIGALDPARQGRDESAYVVRQGKRVIRSTGVRITKSDELGDWALQQMAADELDVLYIDSVGIGGPMLDYMKRMMGPQGHKLRAADVTRAPSSSRFYRVRDEMWWRLRKEFEGDLIQIPNDRVLVNELGAIRQNPPNNKGQTVVETKKQMNDRGMPSPNRADALMMTMFANDAALASAKGSDPYDDLDTDDDNDPYFTSWMGR